MEAEDALALFELYWFQTLILRRKPPPPPIQIPDPNPNPNPNTIFPDKIQGERKSLTDLEFEELKGFMDLGFTFSYVEDPRLISLVPGLQRKRNPSEDISGLKSDFGKLDPAPNVLRNWRIPIAGEGVDLKDNLRLWAHAVASAVR